VATIGWKIGKQHKIEIWFVEYTRRYYVMSEDGKLHIYCRILSKAFITIMQRNKYGRIVKVLDLSALYIR
jgi:hypothetical protein